MALIKDLKRKARYFTSDTTAKGGVLAFYMTILVASIVALSVVIPVAIDQITGLTPTAATGTLTITDNVSCGEYFNITLPNGDYEYYQANFTTPEAGCTLNPDATAWPLNPSPQGNDSVNASYALAVAMEDGSNVSSELVVTNPSDGVVLMTFATTGTSAHDTVVAEDISAGTWSAFAGGIDGVSSVASTILNLLVLFLSLGVLYLYMKPLM